MVAKYGGLLEAPLADPESVKYSKIAKLLRESSMNQRGQMVGGWYVPPSKIATVFDGLTKGAALGADIYSSLKQAESDKKRKSDLAETLKAFGDYSTGKPSTLNDVTGTGEEEVKPDRAKAMAALLANPQTAPTAIASMLAPEADRTKNLGSPFAVQGENGTTFYSNPAYGNPENLGLKVPFKLSQNLSVGEGGIVSPVPGAQGSIEDLARSKALGDWHSVKGAQGAPVSGTGRELLGLDGGGGGGGGGYPRTPIPVPPAMDYKAYGDAIVRKGMQGRGAYQRQPVAPPVNPAMAGEDPGSPIQDTDAMFKTLMSMPRDHPDYGGIAVALVDAMARQGRLAQGAGAAPLVRPPVGSPSPGGVVTGLTPGEEAAQKSMAELPSKQAEADIKSRQAEAEVVSKNMGEQYNKLLEVANESHKTLNNLGELERLLEGYRTSRITPIGTEIARWANSVGIGDDKNIPNKEAAASLIKKLVLGNIGPGGLPASNFSDADMAVVEKIPPSLDNTSEGNRKIISYARAIAKRNIETAEMATRYRKEHGALDGGFWVESGKYAEEHPAFSDETHPPTEAKPLSEGQNDRLRLLREKYKQ